MIRQYVISVKNYTRTYCVNTSHNGNLEDKHHFGNENEPD